MVFCYKEIKMNISLTEKSKNLIAIKEFNGEKYALVTRNKSGDEIWLKMPHDKPDKCAICGYEGSAIQRHHIYGRKKSKETILLCSNCHIELHNGEH
jgi:hypothetical protein